MHLLSVRKIAALSKQSKQRDVLFVGLCQANEKNVPLFALYF
jgi:hypothetical protein